LCADKIAVMPRRQGGIVFLAAHRETKTQEAFFRVCTFNRHNGLRDKVRGVLYGPDR
jgi:hypothetical protein